MLTLFTKPYNDLVNFVFNIYDFNSDGMISKDDIKTVFSYIPLKKSNSKPDELLDEDDENKEFEKQITSQVELHGYLNNIFEHYNTIDEEIFRLNLEEKGSEVFLFVSYLIYFSY